MGLSPGVPGKCQLVLTRRQLGAVSRGALFRGLVINMSHCDLQLFSRMASLLGLVLCRNLGKWAELRGCASRTPCWAQITRVLSKSRFRVRSGPGLLLLVGRETRGKGVGEHGLRAPLPRGVHVRAVGAATAFNFTFLLHETAISPL